MSQRCTLFFFIPVNIRYQGLISPGENNGSAEYNVTMRCVREEQNKQLKQI